MRRSIAVLCIAAAAFLAATCHGSNGRVAYTGTYISLGDSVAAGNGSSDPNATSFVAIVDQAEGSLPLVRLAKAGATTQDVIDKQLPWAIGAMDGNDVAFITISVGGNDLAGLIPNAACVQDPLPAACPLNETLAGVSSRLDTILSRLRAANATAPIVLLAYPNFFSGTGHAFEAPAGRVLPQLDAIIRNVAAKYAHTAVADPSASFEGKGPELTHVLDPQFDPHPNDAGHRIIADAFISALGKAP